MTKTDIDARKKLFEEYAGCRWVEVAKSGEVRVDKPLDIYRVGIDKCGNVFIDWKSEDFHGNCSVVDEVLDAYDGYVVGVFTSVDKAKVVAKEWFLEQDKIAEVFDELADKKSRYSSSRPIFLS